MTTWWTYAVAYLVACVGGWLIVGACMYGMRRWLGMNAKSFAPLELFIGCTERAVALTLVLMAPPYMCRRLLAAGWCSNLHWAGGEQGIANK